MTGSPFNKYCIDCKRNKTTHALVWLGIFVCESCSVKHLNLPNASQSRIFVKNALKEHWDDYQLRSIQLGGNKNFFDILKEYEIVELDFNKKYKHPAVLWYEKDLRAKMDGFEGHNIGKPPKNLKERLTRMEETANRDLDKTSETIEKVSSDMIQKASDFSMKVDQKGKELLDKVKSKAWAKNLMSKFGGNKKQSGESLPEEQAYKKEEDS